MGVELASHIAAGVLLGWLLDRWTGMEPTWLVVGAIAGVVAGMANFIRAALKASRDALRNSTTVRHRPADATDNKSTSPRDSGNSEYGQKD
jgi:F0F1-type ATP synthase assembly protein I